MLTETVLSSKRAPLLVLGWEHLSANSYGPHVDGSQSTIKKASCCIRLTWADNDNE